METCSYKNSSQYKCQERIRKCRQKDLGDDVRQVLSLKFLFEESYIIKYVAGILLRRCSTWPAGPWHRWVYQQCHASKGRSARGHHARIHQSQGRGWPVQAGGRPKEPDCRSEAGKCEGKTEERREGNQAVQSPWKAAVNSPLAAMDLNCKL